MFALTLLAVTVLSAGSHHIELPFGGLTRSYIVHVPPHAPANAPLIVNLHGGGSNAAQQERFSGMDALADREHFIVVYPNGTGRGEQMLVWNAGTCCGAAPAKKIDDVGFIRAVIDDVSKRVSIDRRRIFATGMSNGSMMTYRLAAEAPDLFAAVAPVAGSMVLMNFHSTHPMPIMHFHSVDDPRALYGGGLGLPFPGTNSRVFHQPVEEQLHKWIVVNGCRAAPKVDQQIREKREPKTPERLRQGSSSRRARAERPWCYGS